MDVSHWALGDAFGGKLRSPSIAPLPPPQSPTPVFGYNPTASTIHTPKIALITPLVL
ncbi:hypothetical protein H6G96_32490 [Nostoc sp. FACHB-892]|uniref:hypothetical protein n=1 Tax=Nostoc sp. FACHB-892 TaxID=2692843 RepID=UPI001689D671|nr:hypothetical protein [Nostoc sp. FACHB-892]MBD2730911.1 hypothetical protein [Nostoc sp. FACHB-892]